MKILYDTTYCFRGNSGIPGDAKSVARILSKTSYTTNLLVVPKFKAKRKPTSLLKQNVLVGDAIRIHQGDSVLPEPIEDITSMIRANISSNRASLFQIHTNLISNISKIIGIDDNINNRLKYELSNVSSKRIWGRALTKRRTRINTRTYDVFIQQHVEPIKVSKHTQHIVRLHDILPIIKPQYFTQKAVHVFTKGLSQLLKNKNLIWVMDSEESAREFKTLFGSNREVRVIPCAVRNFHITEEEILNKRNRILILGTIEPRKQIEFALTNFLELKEQKLIDDSWQLVIAGKHGWQELETYKWVKFLHSKGEIIFIENPSDSQVREQLAKASILVSASLAEGFGLTPLEGLANGCQLVVSDIPQHRETLDQFAIFFNPSDGASFKNRILEACSNYETIDDRLKRIQYVSQNYSEDTLLLAWQDLLTEFNKS